MALRPNPWGERPRVAKGSYVDPAAVIIGKVVLGKEVYVAPGAVIRADEPGSMIVIGDRSNIQDRVVIHALGGSTVSVGRETSLAHGCIVHGPCVIGDRCFVGFGSVIFNAVLGDGVVVEHLAVLDGLEVGAGLLVSSGSRLGGMDMGQALRPVEGEKALFAEKVVAANLQLLAGYGRKSPRGRGVLGRKRSAGERKDGQRQGP